MYIPFIQERWCKASKLEVRRQHKFQASYGSGFSWLSLNLAPSWKLLALTSKPFLLCCDEVPAAISAFCIAEIILTAIRSWHQHLQTRFVMLEFKQPWKSEQCRYVEESYSWVLCHILSKLCIFSGRRCTARTCFNKYYSDIYLQSSPACRLTAFSKLN